MPVQVTNLFGMRTTARGQRTRQLILERTAAVIDRQGYAGATLNRLVDSTGLTRGAFYFHFESKDSLAVAIAEQQAQAWQQLLARVEREEREPLRRLVTLVCSTAFAFRDDPVVRAAARLLLDRSLIRQELPQTAPWWVATVSGLLAQAQQNGQLADLAVLERATPSVPQGAGEDGAIRRVAEYLVSQLATIGQLAVSRPGSQFDFQYMHWAMVLPRICADAETADELLALARDLLDPARSLDRDDVPV